MGVARASPHHRDMVPMLADLIIRLSVVIYTEEAGLH